MHAFLWNRFLDFQTGEDNPPILSAHEFAKYFYGFYILFVYFVIELSVTRTRRLFLITLIKYFKISLFEFKFLQILFRVIDIRWYI